VPPRPTHHAIPHQQYQQPPRPVNVFDPATDTDVTTLSANSSSVM
jgi:hypothetical protein